MQLTAIHNHFHIVIVYGRRDHGGLDFLALQCHPKSASLQLQNTLMVLVEHNQAQKYLQSVPKPFQQVSNILFKLTDISSN